MNYGGHYHNTPQNLIEQARAEHLDAVYNLIVNKEERIPDVAQFTTRPLRKDNVLLMQAQEFHSSYWGHLGLLDLDESFPDPGFFLLSGIALASPYPHNGVIAAWHTRSMVWSDMRIPLMACQPRQRSRTSNALPADVAWANADYYELVVSPITAPSADIWYRLLNLGFRVPAGAGTDAMANYASLRALWHESGIHRRYG